MKNGKFENGKKITYKIHYIGFDMDGTLINTMSSSPKIFGRIMAKNFKIDKNIAERFFLETLGLPTYKQIQILLNILKGDTIGKDKAIKLGDEVDAGLIKLKADIFPDVIPVLKILKNKGFKLFLSSSHKEAAIIERLNEFKIKDYFEFYAGKSNDMPKFTKGEPHFRAAAKHFQTPYKKFCKKTLYIGDAKKDIESSVHAGVKAIGRVGTFSSIELLDMGAYDVVYDLSTLPDLISKIK